MILLIYNNRVAEFQAAHSSNPLFSLLNGFILRKIVNQFL